jgi:hypothetical protein
MVQQSSTVSFKETPFSAKETPCLARTQSPLTFAPEHPFNPFPFQKIETANAELATIPPQLVHLDFKHLGCFEVVERQFIQWGIEFHNAIALHPSNPSFPVENGHAVLMGAPRAGLLDATFTKPVRLVSALLTGSRRTVMTAFDAAGAIVAKAEIPKANLAHPDAPYAPNQHLHLQARAIHRIRVRSIGGQFTMGNVSFGY